MERQKTEEGRKEGRKVGRKEDGNTNDGGRKE
jgi:hypothetical protein